MVAGPGPAGRVDALVRVTRLDDRRRYVIDTDAGFGEALLARLNRFKLRTKITFDVLDWRVIAVRGPAGRGAAALSRLARGRGCFMAGPEWRRPHRARTRSCLTVSSGLSGRPTRRLRIEAGVPMMGAELTEQTIPAEAGVVDRTVSFTKGCYTGQELVARIDSRGSERAPPPAGRVA